MSAIDEDVRIALSQASVDNNILRLEGQLDRKLYLRVNKVLEGLGAKWDRKLGGHRFEVPDLRERLEGVVATGVFVDPQRAFNFFETPRAVVERMVQHRSPLQRFDGPGFILEPSAGKGAIVSVANELLSGKSQFLTYEAMDQNRAVLAGIPNVRILGDDFLIPHEDIVDQILEVTDGTGLDAVLMNPPFANQADLQHVRQAIDVLEQLAERRRGYRIPLVAVMSQGVRFRTNAKTVSFKERLRDFPHEWEDLPEGSFRESGTDVRTTLLVVRV
ncbi:MAG: hypothetical protein HC828_04050 [Blastochloris sp.]|nr:hypothetical protein [Blastochloris sp.]